MRRPFDRLSRELTRTARISAHSLWRAVLGFYYRDNLTHAASIAYYALLSLFPFSLLALTVLGRATADDGDRSEVLRFVLQYFPAQFDFITTQLNAFRAGEAGVSLVGTIALAWGALGIFGAITTAVNYAWGVDQAPSYWQHKLVSFLMLLVAGAMLLAAVVLVSATQAVEASSFAGVVRQFPGLVVLQGLAVRNATTLMFIVVVGLVYYFVPNTKVRFRDVWIGAVLTGLLWRGAVHLFSWYVTDMSRFTRINGSIAVVVVFLVWVYLQAVIFLYGVEFTAAYARLRNGMPDPALPASVPL